MHGASKPKTGDWAWACCALALVAAGLALRLLVARGDLWLDEIWSRNLAEAAGSWTNVFTSTHSDNNHYLTTLWMRQFGPGAPAILIRIPSLLAGLASMLTILARPLGINRREALAWLFLVALSPILVEYDSEARGYGMALAFGVMLVWMLGRHLQDGRRGWLAGVTVAASLGMLAHLTFAYVIAGCVAWAGLSWWRQRPGGPSLGWLISAFLLPALVTGALWYLDLRQLQVGGGNPYVLAEVLRSLFAYTLGLPSGPLAWLGFFAALAALWEILRLAREGKPEWILFATTIFIDPGLVLAIARPSILAPRYFLMGIPFLLLLLGRALARVSRGRERAAAGLVLASVLATGFQNAYLVADMRGSYGEAVDDMVRDAPAGEATLSSDHDFRNRLVFAYYARRNPAARELRYVNAPFVAAHPPYWYLRHEFVGEGQRAARIQLRGGRYYNLVKAYPYAGLSGWTWLLYQREDPREF